VYAEGKRLHDEHIPVAEIHQHWHLGRTTSSTKPHDDTSGDVALN